MCSAAFFAFAFFCGSTCGVFIAGLMYDATE
jgi:hypothetical protein